MTTIGYGNQNVSTTGGRTLVYTVGFASILQVGFIVTNAGDFHRRFWEISSAVAVDSVG